MASESPGMKDVAARAGVSVGTVSNVLNRPHLVSESTRSRVQAAIVELGFVRNETARQLRAGRSRTVAIVLPFINSWYFANVIAGAEAVCADVGYDLLVLTTPSPATRAAMVAGTVGLDRRADGMIFVEVALAASHVAEFERLGVGVVTIGQRTDQFPSISIDNVGIGRTAVDHLVALAHTRIGVLAGHAEDPVHFDVPGQRIEGARLALAAVGERLDPRLIASGQFTVDGGHRAATALLRRRQRPTALFALSDEMAFGALLAARDLGLDIPGDVSLVGVDDHESADVMGLTTVRQHVVEHGAVAARALLRQLTGGPHGHAVHTVNPSELIVRRSTRLLGDSDA
jgi:DNA-binding LacI/PurR family transcriptional regulator